MLLSRELDPRNWKQGQGTSRNFVIALRGRERAGKTVRTALSRPVLQPLSELDRGVMVVPECREGWGNRVARKRAKALEVSTK